MLLSISFSISSSLCPSLHAPNNFFPIWIHQIWDKLLILEVEKEGSPLSSKWWALFREYKITRYERWVSMLSGHLPFSKWVKSVLDEQRIMCPPLQAGYCTQEGVGPQKSCVLPSSKQRRTGTPASWASAATGWDPAGSGSPQPWPWYSPHVVHGHVSRWDGQASHSVSETDCWGSRDPWMLLKHIAKCLPDFYILQHHFGT